MLFIRCDAELLGDCIFVVIYNGFVHRNNRLVRSFPCKAPQASAAQVFAGFYKSHKRVRRAMTNSPNASNKYAIRIRDRLCGEAASRPSNQGTASTACRPGLLPSLCSRKIGYAPPNIRLTMSTPPQAAKSASPFVAMSSAGQCGVAARALSFSPGYTI